MTTQPRLWQGGHHPEAATVRGRHHAHGRAAEHNTMAATLGLQGCRLADEVVKSHCKHRGARVEAPARPAGVDQATRARSTERSSAAMASLKARSMKPHGQEEEHGEAEQMRHRAAAELTGARRSRARNASVIQSRQRGLRLGIDQAGERVRGGRLGRVGSVKPTRVD
jgi:hypothetical protein